MKENIKENVLKGVEGAKIVLNRAGLDYLYSTLTAMEKVVVVEVKNHLDVMRESGYLSADNNIKVASVFNKNKREFPTIVVEVSGKLSANQGIGGNKQTIVYDDGTHREEFMMKSAQFEITINLNCISTTRDSVAKVADALMVGFTSDLSVKLASQGISVMFNKINYPNKINRSELVKDTALFEIPISIPNTIVTWQQFYSIDGNILKDIKYYETLVNLAVIE